VYIYIYIYIYIFWFVCIGLLNFLWMYLCALFLYTVHAVRVFLS